MSENGYQTMPAEIAAAIAEVKSHIQKLAKTEQNSFNRYNYTSVDSFYAAVGPLEAAAGLAIVMTEAEPPEILPMPKADKEGTSSWLKIRWAITIAHKSGATYGPILRTVMVPASGAQAFGSAESYIGKQFARCLYRIPTGDKDDADAQEKQELPATRRQREQTRRSAPTETVAELPAKGEMKQPPTFDPAVVRDSIAKANTLERTNAISKRLAEIGETKIGVALFRELMRELTDREKAIHAPAG